MTLCRIYSFLAILAGMLAAHPGYAAGVKGAITDYYGMKPRPLAVVDYWHSFGSMVCSWPCRELPERLRLGTGQVRLWNAASLIPWSRWFSEGRHPGTCVPGSLA